MRHDAAALALSTATSAEAVELLWTICLIHAYRAPWRMHPVHCEPMKHQSSIRGQGRGPGSVSSDMSVAGAQLHRHAQLVPRSCPRVATRNTTCRCMHVRFLKHGEAVGSSYPLRRFPGHSEYRRGGRIGQGISLQQVMRSRSSYV